MTQVERTRVLGRYQDLIIRNSAETSAEARTVPEWLRGRELTGRMQDVTRPGSFELGSPWNGQPWLTPILGSGPLGVPSEFIERAGEIPDALLERLRREEDVWAQFQRVGAVPEMWVKDFTRKMILQRVGDEHQAQQRVVAVADGQSSSPDDALRIEEDAALLMLVAAQLTRTFHRISLDTCRPVSRWGSEGAILNHDHDRWYDFAEEYGEPLQFACDRAIDALQRRFGVHGDLVPHTAASTKADDLEERHNETLLSIIAVLHDIRSVVGEHNPRVSFVHLEQISEAAWYRLVGSVTKSAYPGWTNLMLRLVFADSASVGKHFMRPRWTELERLGRQIDRIVRPVARASWQRWNKESQRENREFYEAVARTLWMQAVALDHYPPPRDSKAQEIPAYSGRPPRPLAFVSSFDYELEMALWRTARDGYRQFSLVVPVYAVDRNPNVGRFLWLEAIINTAPRPSQSEQVGDADFEAMLNVSSWRLLHDPDQGDSDQQSKSVTAARASETHPIVVRIVGCPLLKLPTKDEIKEGQLGKGLAGTNLQHVTHLIHAVTVDEYLAYRQTGRDWTRGYDTANPAYGSLPKDLFSPIERGPRRYWMVMGVPFKDPAVRLRVMSVLANEGQVSPSRIRKPVENTEPADAPAQSAPHLPSGRRLGSKGSVDAGLLSPSEPAAPQPSVKVHASMEGTREHARDEADRPETRYGVAINVRVDDEETLLLSALSFDVVRGRCETFTSGLDGHADWLFKHADEVSRLSRLGPITLEGVQS